ncbi:MAG: hypothetical protein PHN69_00150 [Candidatus Pacebacteria bacterium]|nr:hypothetical protein [Candidatus Paceibacterota bacterium]
MKIKELFFLFVETLFDENFLALLFVILLVGGTILSIPKEHERWQEYYRNIEEARSRD